LSYHWDRNVPSPSENSDDIEELYRLHGGALVLFGLAICGDRSLAQDAVHQVFLKFVENGSLQRATNKKAYVFAAVRNALLNENKVQFRNAPLEPDSAWFIPPERDYVGEANLRRALGALPDEQRQVVVLHVWGDLTFSEVADLLAISADTAASRYRYALAKMREVMGAVENLYDKS
jgi:RNA polymerase sigma-70 factor (ECF subfamily)